MNSPLVISFSTLIHQQELCDVVVSIFTSILEVPFIFKAISEFLKTLKNLVFILSHYCDFIENHIKLSQNNTIRIDNSFPLERSI